MELLKIQILGDFYLTYGQEEITGIAQGRLQSLLAYLLLHRHAPQPRHHIAFRLWPDSTEAQARTNLRREVHHLRRLLPEADSFLTVNQSTIQWRADAPFWLDVVEFEELAATAAKVEAAGRVVGQIRGLEEATKLYRGPLLPGCYEEWIFPLREQLDHLYMAALETLALLHEEQRAYGAAIGVAERLLQHDRLHETSYRHLMRLYLLSGDRARALRLYHDCSAILKQELDVEPSLETQTIYESLLRVESKSTPAEEHPATRRIEERTTLVGRANEWQALLAAWRTANRGSVQLVIISGEAGIGKTRLAEELLIWASRQGYLVARTRAYEMEGSLAYAPVTLLLRSEELASHWSKLPALWLAELVRILPEVSESHPDLPPAQPLSESWQRQRFFEAIARSALASGDPRIILFDDVQWCDRETIEWIHYLMRFASEAKLLILCTMRSEEIAVEHPLVTLRLAVQREGQLVEVELGPLGSVDTEILATQTAGYKLSTGFHKSVSKWTSGYPS